MITPRLPKAERGKAWCAIIEIGPIRLSADDPIHEVLPAHLELLIAQGIHYEVLKARPNRDEKLRP